MMDAILVATDRTHRLAAGDKENVPVMGCLPRIDGLQGV